MINTFSSKLIATFIVISALYYLTSPYQICMRNSLSYADYESAKFYNIAQNTELTDTQRNILIGVAKRRTLQSEEQYNSRQSSSCQRQSSW